MSLKKLKEFPNQHDYAKSLYDLPARLNEPLAAKASRAASRIYLAGQARRDGRTSPGHNNVMADFAAAAFSRKELKDLRASGDPLQEGFARIISLRQVFIRAWERDEAKGLDPYWRHTDKLEKIAQTVRQLEQRHGWTPRIP